MEAGTLISQDVLPKLAKEYRKAAQANGAFETASKKTRAELNRTMGELSLFKNSVFEGGFGEGLSDFFRTTTYLLADLKPFAELVGKTLKWAFIGLAAAMNIAAVPFRIISNLFNDLDDTTKEFVGGGLVLAAAGAWLMYAKTMSVATKAIWGFIAANRALMAIPWIAAALAAEDLGRTIASDGTADTVIRRLAVKASGDENIKVGGLGMALQTSNPLIYGAKIGQMLGQKAMQLYNSPSATPRVDIKIDANGLNEKQIDTQIKHSMSNIRNDIASESKG